MLSAEYNRSRQLALQANNIEQSSCVGDAECCQPLVQMATGDIDIILTGIKEGTIPLKILQEAYTRSRSRDPQRLDRCPFLNEANRCSIYSSRPVRCITWGIGGKPFEPEHYKAALRRYKEGGPEQYPNLKLNLETCMMCRSKRYAHTTSLQANELAREAMDNFVPIFRNGEVYTIGQFVGKELSKIKGVKIVRLPELLQ